MTARTGSSHRQVFVDSSAYFATAVPRDSNHALAQMILAGLQRHAAHMVTTRCIVAESHALVINRLRDARRAARLLRQIEASASTTIVAATDGDEARARAIIERYDDHLFTLTDAISFAVMERLRLVYAFSFDSDFAAFGFTTLTLDLLR